MIEEPWDGRDAFTQQVNHNCASIASLRCREATGQTRAWPLDEHFLPRSRPGSIQSPFAGSTPSEVWMIR